MVTFNTVLYRLQHPRNIGMITRSHIAFGGDKLIFLGYDAPWQYDEEATSYATGLQDRCPVLNFLSVESYLNWSKENALANYAVEIAKTSKSLPGFNFNKSCNLIFGNEFEGVPQEVLSKCDETLIIPQYGPAGCLNVAIAASIAFYEFKRNIPASNIVDNTKYFE